MAHHDGLSDDIAVAIWKSVKKYVKTLKKVITFKNELDTEFEANFRVLNIVSLEPYSITE